MSPLVRKFGIADGAIALTTALVFGGHRFYRKWEKEHLFEQDAGFVAKSDLRSATLCLQKILAADPNQLPATLLRPYSSSRRRWTEPSRLAPSHRGTCPKTRPSTVSPERQA